MKRPNGSDEGSDNMPENMPGPLGWDEHGHAHRTGLPIDAVLGAGGLQDAENCGYPPVRVLVQLGVDHAPGDPYTQFRQGRIELLDGTILERGGTLGCVWAVTQLPALCPVCHPPSWYDDPPEVSLRPDACPARANHDAITRAFGRLNRMEARPYLTTLDLEAAALVKARIEELRTVTP